jgi:hypothetical protein
MSTSTHKLHINNIGVFKHNRKRLLITILGRHFVRDDAKIVLKSIRSTPSTELSTFQQ